MKRSIAIWMMLAMLLPCLVMAQPQPNFFKQGMDHYNAGEYDAAIASFQKVVNGKPGPNAKGTPNPKKADAFYYIGMSMVKKGDHAGAISNFTRALETRPAYLQAMFARGSSYIETKQYDAAVADLSKVVEEQPGNVDANYQLAMAHSWLAHYSEAIPYFNKVLELNPRNAYAHYWVGLAYYKTKDVKKMIDHFEIFLDLMPDAPEAPQVKQILAQAQG